MPSVRDFIVLERPAWEESKVVVYGQSETLCFWFLVHSESLVHARTFWKVPAVYGVGELALHCAVHDSRR